MCGNLKMAFCVQYKNFTTKKISIIIYNKYLQVNAKKSMNDISFYNHYKPLIRKWKIKKSYLRNSTQYRTRQINKT